MEQELFTSMAARRGHFLLESGHHGELWLDVDRLFVQPEALQPQVERLAARLSPYEVAAVCGPLTGGAFLAQRLAERMGTKFVYADRALPTERSSAGLFSVEYPIPRELVEFVAGRRVALVNDVINAGSAVRSALDSLRRRGAEVVVVGAFLVLGELASAWAAAERVPLETLARAANRIWTPSECPLCAAGAPLCQPNLRVH